MTQSTEMWLRGFPVGTVLTTEVDGVEYAVRRTRLGWVEESEGTILDSGEISGNDFTVLYLPQSPAPIEHRPDCPWRAVQATVCECEEDR